MTDTECLSNPHTDESLSHGSDDIDRLFAPMKQEADSSFLDLSSSGYREGSAFGGDNDDDDDDEDDFWGDAASSVSSAKCMDNRVVW